MNFDEKGICCGIALTSFGLGINVGALLVALLSGVFLEDRPVGEADIRQPAAVTDDSKAGVVAWRDGRCGSHRVCTSGIDTEGVVISKRPVAHANLDDGKSNSPDVGNHDGRAVRKPSRSDAADGGDGNISFLLPSDGSECEIGCDTSTNARECRAECHDLMRDGHYAHAANYTKSL